MRSNIHVVRYGLMRYFWQILACFRKIINTQLYSSFRRFTDISGGFRNEILRTGFGYLRLCLVIYGRCRSCRLRSYIRLSTELVFAPQHSSLKNGPSYPYLYGQVYTVSYGLWVIGTETAGDIRLLIRCDRVL